MDVVVTLMAITAIAAVRSQVAPVQGEAVANVATPLGGMLQRSQLDMPILAVVIWAMVAFAAGVNAGRYGVKYSLYPAYTLMAIPLWRREYWSAATIWLRRQRRCAACCR